MKSRLTNWITAALLLLVASFGVPVARTEVSLQSSIVWVDGTGEAQREFVEPRRNPAPPCSEKTVAAARKDSRARVTLLDRSLFQRPPPVSFS